LNSSSLTGASALAEEDDEETWARADAAAANASARARETPRGNKETFMLGWGLLPPNRSDPATISSL
jgi:hypothetical protein